LSSVPAARSFSLPSLPPVASEAAVIAAAALAALLSQQV